MRTNLNKKSVPVDAGSTKETIRKAATHLFAKHGLDGVTVRQIADTAGVNLCLISYYFDGKEGLYRSCIEEYGKSRLSLVQDLMTPAKTVEEFQMRLKFIVEQLMEKNAQNSDASLLMSREIEIGLPNARAIFESTLLKAMEKFVHFMKDAQKRGFVRSNLDARTVVLMINSTVIHFLRSDPLLSHYFKVSIFSEKNRKEMSASIVDTLIYGILETNQ